MSAPTRSTEPLDTYTLNMGPQHPSTHGVLRLKLTLQGERVLEVDPVIGYSHRAHEKMAEGRTYAQFFPNTSRQDYLSGLIYNVAWAEAVEKIAGIAVPDRALVARVILSEFNRISSHLLWVGAFLMDLGAALVGSIAFFTFTHDTVFKLTNGYLLTLHVTPRIIGIAAAVAVGLGVIACLAPGWAVARLSVVRGLKTLD